MYIIDDSHQSRVAVKSLRLNHFGRQTATVDCDNSSLPETAILYWHNLKEIGG